jgi:hypothetical protein
MDVIVNEIPAFDCKARKCCPAFDMDREQK